MGLFNDDMTGLAAAYASMNDGKYLLTNADKVGNTPAWQNRYKINETTGEMLYEMADHLKEAYEEELIARIDATLEELRRLDEGKIPVKDGITSFSEIEYLKINLWLNSWLKNK